MELKELSQKNDQEYFKQPVFLNLPRQAAA